MPFSEAALNTTVFAADDYYRLLYYIVTEKDIEQAIALLPDIGLSEKEKEARCKK